MRLGVNVDHVATVREARRGREPDPVTLALLCEEAGCHQITVHLREDRRHIQDRDVRLLRELVKTRLNLEMAPTEEMVGVALSVRPDVATLVPERREELTTEGGLDVAGQIERVKEACARLADAGIRVSLFIDPDEKQLEAAVACGAPVVELHTGAYAEAQGKRRAAELRRVAAAVEFGDRLDLIINAGHGLNYDNVAEIAAIPQIVELNIGHAIISRAVFDGLAVAVSEMKRLMTEARGG